MISLPSWTLSASNRATHVADVRQGAEHRGQVHSKMGNTGAFRRRLCLSVRPRRQQSPALPSHHLPPAPHTPPHHKSSCTLRMLCREGTLWWRPVRIGRDRRCCQHQACHGCTDRKAWWGALQPSHPSANTGTKQLAASLGRQSLTAHTTAVSSSAQPSPRHDQRHCGGPWCSLVR